ncbi:AadS family aminoglycoside 6-adenylyltransferase [Sphingobacterium sp.]|uniref:AadS family aminoglycoside 6-adenylyltransferase n=1 Tax=Sphingobacterium sp. TaxID=341027 RepID=UPI002FDD08A4
MKFRDEKLKMISEWAQDNEDIRAALLTSSLVNPLAPVDDLSDLDIELVFNDNAGYITDNSWIRHFGHAISMIEEDESCFEGRHGMKMVLYDDYVKVDFKLYSKVKFLVDIEKAELPEDWDIGYKVLVDKDGITSKMQKPSYQISIIKKPTVKKVQQVLNDFWWDTTYVAKSLVRDELFYAKFASEHIIRVDYLIPLIEWYIASQHNWNITTNKYGRLFKKYLTEEMWVTIERTFAGSSIPTNWDALFAMADLVSAIGKLLAEKLDFNYPVKLETDIRKYLLDLRAKS